MTDYQTLCLFVIVGVVAFAHGVWWNRRFTRRLFVKTFRQELRRELQIMALTGQGDFNAKHDV